MAITASRCEELGINIFAMASQSPGASLLATAVEEEHLLAFCYKLKIRKRKGKGRALGTVDNMGMCCHKAKFSKRV